MKKTSIAAFSIALCGASLFGQQSKLFQLDGNIFPADGPEQEPPAPLQNIFSNLGPATSAFTNSGWTLSGPASAIGITQFVALPFTPGVAVTAGVQYWIVADTPVSGTGSDFAGVWAFVPPSKNLAGINSGSSWVSFPASIHEPASAA